MSSGLDSIGDWVNKLFDDIFYGADDDAAIQAFEAHVAPDMIAKYIMIINHSQVDFDRYREMVKQTRSKYKLIPQSNTEILSWDDGEKKGGSVAHLTKFLLEDKVSQEKFPQATNLIVIVKWINGNRLITGMTEVWCGGYE